MVGGRTRGVLVMAYPGVLVPPRSSGPMPVVTNPSVDDVEGSFAGLRRRADFMACHDGGEFKRHRYTRRNFSGGRSRIHFQGVQRSRTGKYLFLSGGDVLEPAAQLFVVRMNTRPADGPWGTNIRFDRKPAAADRVIGMYKLDTDLWHAGGISLMGDVLAVPLEDDRRSEVRFYDVSDARAPTRFDAVIRRGPSVGRATAVALTRLPNDHYLCAVWAEDPLRLDFYLSRDTDFENGFRSRRTTWLWSDLAPRSKRSPRYQTINFVSDTDGTLFVVTSESAKKAPFTNADRIELLRVDLDSSTLSLRPGLLTPRVSLEGSRRLERGGDYHNLAASGGIHVDRLTRELLLYGGFHWRIKKQIRLAEWVGDLSPDDAVIDDVARGRIDLFEDPDLRGRRLSIYGRRDAAIEDYDKIRVRDKSFGDRVSSIRYQLPEGEAYRLFTKRGYRDGRGASSFDLVGTGQVETITDLSLVWEDDEVDSSRFLD